MPEEETETGAMFQEGNVKRESFVFEANGSGGIVIEKRERERRTSRTNTDGDIKREMCCIA